MASTCHGPFAKIVINVSDSHLLHEPQQFTVSGDAQHAHVTGLVENTAMTLVWQGPPGLGTPSDPSLPLSWQVLIQRFSLVGLEFWDRKRGKGDRHSTGKWSPKYSLRSMYELLSKEKADTVTKRGLSQPLLGNVFNSCTKLPRISCPIL